MAVVGGIARLTSRRSKGRLCGNSRSNGRTVYRGVASEKSSSLADAVSAAIRRYRPVAFPLGVSKAAAAGPAAGAHGAPFVPSAVHRGRSGAHVHALLMDAPLNSRATHTALFYIAFVPRVRRMQYVSRATLRLTRIPISSAESRAKFPDTSIYFPGAIKSTSAARERAEGDEIYIREKREAREEGASFNKSLSLLAEKERGRNALLFRYASGDVPGTWIAPRKWLSIASKAICARVRLIIDVTSQRHIIYVTGNICGCINNDAKRLLNNPRRGYILPQEQVLPKLRAPCSRRTSYRQPSATPGSSSSCWSSTTRSRSRSPEIYTRSQRESGLIRLVLKE